MSNKNSYIQVQGPASPQVRRVLQRMHGPDTKEIEKVQVEPSGKPGQLGYVTNSPEDIGTIHIPEQNIKRQLQKAQPGVDQKTLNEQQEALIEDVVIPHEQAHIQDVNKGEGKFSPTTEQIAEKAEDWSRMEEQFGITPKGKFAMENLISILDNLADTFESKGLVKEATQLDIVSNTLADSRSELIYNPELENKINDTKYNTFRAYLSYKNSNYIDINAHTLTQAEGIIDGLGFKDKVIAIKKV
jgi:hypothetical protein